MTDAFHDLALFAQIARSGSLAQAGRALGVTGAAVSKRLAALERRLGLRLIQRTTRTLRLTPEGERYLREGGHLLAGLEELEQDLRGVAAQPAGMLRINASPGFGRAVVAGIASEFARQHPGMEIQLQLSDRPANLVDDGFDVGIRIGTLHDSSLIARKIQTNRRLICASPGYLKQHGAPLELVEINRHRVIMLHENEQIFGTWNLRKGPLSQSLKVRSRMSTNDGEIALGWAVAGFGLLLRSEWSLRPLLRAGQLQVVLPDWCEPADVYAVYPSKHHLSAKTRTFIDFLSDKLGAVDNLDCHRD